MTQNVQVFYKMEGEQTPSLSEDVQEPTQKTTSDEPDAVQDQAEPEATLPPPETQADEPQAKEPPQEPVKGKPPKPKAPKEQCPICLRWYSLARVAPGMHKCVPPVPKSAEPEYDREGRPMPEPPKPPEPPAPVEPPKFEERQINYDDVMRFLTRERMSRHERKRGRWAQQMFG